MFEWIENCMEWFDCDYETAEREYLAVCRPDLYDPEDYEGL